MMNTKADVNIINHGSLIAFHLLTEAATDFVAENVSDESQFFGNALMVEPRYAQDLLYGMQDSGLVVL